MIPLEIVSLYIFNIDNYEVKLFSYFYIFILIFVFYFLAITVVYASPSGYIQVNINNHNQIDEFEFDVKNGSLKETYQIKKEKVNQSSNISNLSQYFEEGFKKERLGDFALEKEISDLFNSVNFSSFDALDSSSLKGKCKQDAVYSIDKISSDLFRGNGSIKNIFNEIRANNQLSYFVLNPHYYLSGIVLDLSNNQIYFPFCGEQVRNAAWSGDGRFIAYSVTKNIDPHGNFLVIKDVFQKRTVFEQQVEKGAIADLSWSPDSQYIAILVNKSRTSIITPWRLLSTIVGHPVQYENFFLQIYNLDGQSDLDPLAVIENVQYGSGSIIWTEASRPE